MNESKLDPPTGPTSGFEKWINQARATKDDIIDALKSDSNVVTKGVHKIKEKWEEFEKIRAGGDKPTNISEGRLLSASDKSVHQVVKLIVIGDSLVAGVGNDDPLASPVLPQMIASTLSKQLKADVVWISMGIVGGTVVDQREKALPTINEKLEKLKSTSSANENVKYVVVITCGLNDFKSIFFDFPSGLWPGKFNSKLKLLLHDVIEMCSHDGNSCDVFLPNLPLVCMKADPKYVMGVQPLGFIVDTMANIWDAEKQRVAEENDNVRRIDLVCKVLSIIPLYSALLYKYE